MLRIRPYKPQDSIFLLKWLTDETDVTFWKADRFVWPLTEGQLEKYYNDFEAASDAFAFTVLDDAGEVTGHFSIRNVNWEENRGHLGFIVVNPEARGKGYGRSMVELALEYAFKILGLQAVTLGVYDHNEPAKRCYASLGFQRVDRSGFEARWDEFHGRKWEYYYLEARSERR